MSEEELEIDVKEAVEKLEGGWSRYLALSTALIAVFAAIASLESGTYSNQAVLEKNNAVLFQNKASDQWNYYQAKGVKKNIAEAFYEESGYSKFKADAAQYTKEQADIQTQATAFENQVAVADAASEHLLEKHHQMAYSVTFFQIAIALAAISSLMRRRSFFYFSLACAAGGIFFMVRGFML